jgi:hypothetical protein
MSTGRMERVQTALRTKRELCALDDLYGAALANGRNDLSTLANKFGWQIDSWRVSHGEGPSHKHYRLKVEGRSGYTPRRAIQQRLLTT